MLAGKIVMKAGKGVVRAGTEYNNMDHMNKHFQFCSILQAISRLPSISTTNIGLMVFFQEIVLLKQKR